MATIELGQHHAKDWPITHFRRAQHGHSASVNKQKRICVGPVEAWPRLHSREKEVSEIPDRYFAQPRPIVFKRSSIFCNLFCVEYEKFVRTDTRFIVSDFASVRVRVKILQKH